MKPNNPLTVVAAWQAAVNDQAVERLLALSDSNIAIVGPRGVAHGHNVLRDWVARAGLQFTPQRYFVREQQVVVAQHAVWHSPETGAVIGDADVASHLTVDDACVIAYARYDTLTEVLAAGELDLTDEVIDA